MMAKMNFQKPLLKELKSSVLTQLCCLIFIKKFTFFLSIKKIKFFQIFSKKSSKEQHLFEIEIFCNIINVFTVTLHQFNAYLLNKYINL